MTIVVEAAAISRGLADISDAAQTLTRARASATRRVDDLMATWHGAAAESFATAYAAWASAAADVHARLEALREGVASTGTALGAADGSTAADVEQLARRLG